MKLFIFLSIFLTAMTLTGCATISGNGEQEVKFDTHQTGLKLHNYKDVYVCDLPCSLMMDGNSARFFVAKGEGYKSKMITVDISKNAASRANVFIAPSLIDNFTGASVDLADYVLVELEEE
ncbi:MAG: hypothetical protein ACTH58_17750 [Marinomonas foliarum]|uniref:hypothetical protein n=1 Tax=Marinomonas foliarum TaxID=491950 RepID=UPI003F9777F7